MQSKEAKKILGELKKLGTAQNRKIFARHGVVDEQYGVSYANLGKLKKKIKKNHLMALELWETGNHDARVLACMIADPMEMKGRLLNDWIRVLNNKVLVGLFSELVSQGPQAKKCMEKWTKAKREWISSTGWNMLTELAMGNEALSNQYLENFLGRIEADIHKSKNRVRHAMNMALIAIGIRNSTLQKKAIAIAKRIGKVEVDHGETSCKTPDAVAYIKKTLERKKKKKS
ncbi:MAG: DNA alkylation repair protein [Nitrospinaceae bacterium]|nr:MAG: DNA alkylation repair protein [Nitrospinaceae bacterium]